MTTLLPSDIDDQGQVRALLDRGKIPSRTAAMDSTQTTTNSYAEVSESLLDIDQHDRLRYVVTEDGTNAIDAKVVGRMYDDEGNAGPWVDAAGSNATASSLSGGNAVLYPDDVVYDEYAVQVVSNSTDSAGEVKVYGVARA